MATNNITRAIKNPSQLNTVFNCSMFKKVKKQTNI